MDPVSFQGGRVILHPGDCLEVLRRMPVDSIDSVVTDPPYALVSIRKRFGKAGAAAVRVPEGGSGAYARASAGFMGKAWDTGERAFATEFWAEVLRVLKPGGHVVAFAGTRTYHRLACAIEDAGFEIRDQIGWCYASGFPKSHDVAKGIDRAAKAEREVVSERPNRSSFDLDRQGGGGFQRGTIQVSVPATEAAAQWQGWGTALKPSYEPLVFARKPGLFSDEWVTIAADLERLESQLWSMLPAKAAERVFGLSRADFDAVQSGSAQWLAESGSNTRDALSDQMGMSLFVSATISSLNTVSLWRRIWDALSNRESMFITGTESKATIDWRTLKFSLSKTTPDTIIPAHRSGQWSSADASLAEAYFNATLSTFAAILERSALASAIDLWQRTSQAEGAPSPAWEPICLARKPLIGSVAENVLRFGTGAVHVDACRIDDGETRRTSTGGMASKGSPVFGAFSGPTATATATALGRWPANIVHDGSDEVVSAFPTASGQQRSVGPQHGAKTSVHCYGDFGPRGQCDPRGDGGSAARFFYSAKADANDRIGSKHPTVKPVDLMRWLVRLVTPPGGTILDPFAGTGTTGEAAFREGFQAVLVEREAEYQADIARRMELVLAGSDARKEAILQAKGEAWPEGAPMAIDLFDGATL